MQRALEMTESVSPFPEKLALILSSIADAVVNTVRSRRRTTKAFAKAAAESLPLPTEACMSEAWPCAALERLEVVDEVLVLDGRAEEPLRDPRALAALGQARFPLRGSILSARALCPRAPSQSHSRNPATIRLAPNSTTHGARGRPQYSQQASECVGFDSPMARPICNLCFPSLLLAGKASGVGITWSCRRRHRARPAVIRWHFAMRGLAGPLDCPLRPSGRLEVYAVDLRLPPFGKLLAAYLEHKARLLRASSPLGQRFACRLRESCPDAPCSRSRGDPLSQKP